MSVVNPIPGLIDGMKGKDYEQLTPNQIFLLQWLDITDGEDYTYCQIKEGTYKISKPENAKNS
jgi:hypothetical protein